MPPGPRHRASPGRRLPWLVRVWVAVLAGWLLSLSALAQGVDLGQLETRRRDGELQLDYQARLSLTPAIEEALQRGVPLYFTAQVTVLRNRWYWRDERLARASRTWRVAYQPLTAQWRVSLGGLSQSYATLSEALAPLSRVSGWKLLEADKLEAGERHYLEFSFRLDNNLLPPPMQVDIGNDWKLRVERTQRID
ncbi:MAG: DUF4390 domain-containing protein [Burkholderiaceae bacterium]|nr:DUF4390 domain-containing protein [Burkholderiaceae bacterium]